MDEELPAMTEDTIKKPKASRIIAKAPALVLTAAAFAVFGLGGLFFYILRPAFALALPTKRRRHLAARRVVVFWFSWFTKFIEAMGLVKVRVRNKEKLLRPGLVIVANHPTLIDVVCLLGIIPAASTVVKSSLLKNPFTKAPIRAAGYISNDAGPDALDSFREELEAGSSFLIFPEGTRTPMNLPPGTHPRIHRGVAALAIQTQKPLTPVRITASPRWLTKELGWWHLPDKPMELVFDVLDDIPSSGFGETFKSSPSKATRALSKILLSKLFDN